jgi:hypothetical protein
MNPESSDAVIQITSSNSNNKNFGTGFIFHRDNLGTYVLMCAHVIYDLVGKVGEDQILASGLPANIVALGEVDGFDLVVLRVSGLESRPLLHLNTKVLSKTSLYVYAFLKNPWAMLRKFEVKLGERFEIENNPKTHRAEGWDIHVVGEDKIKPGFSGAPVINSLDGTVIAVLIGESDTGKKGKAISIEALEYVWPDMPDNLFADSNKRIIEKTKQETQGTQKVIEEQKEIKEMKETASKVEEVSKKAQEIKTTAEDNKQNSPKVASTSTYNSSNYSSTSTERPKLGVHEANSLNLGGNALGGMISDFLNSFKR